MSKPPECCECNRAAKVLYKENPLPGTPSRLLCRECTCREEKLSNLNGVIACANCLTTLEAVREGHPLGCSHCYTIFGDFLLDELLSEYSPSRFQETTEVQVTVQPGVLDNKLSILYLYLEEALEQEDYEQVSRLQHQIEFLKEDARMSPSILSQNRNVQ